MNTIARASILISTLAAAACLSTAASAQAPGIQAPACPARYEPLSGFCYDKISGDIVVAQTASSPLAFNEASCRAGYAILFETLCYSNVTGDIEVASGPAPERTGKLPDDKAQIVVHATSKQR